MAAVLLLALLSVSVFRFYIGSLTTHYNFRSCRDSNKPYARLRNMLKSYHQASFARYFLRPSFLRDVFTWLFFSSWLLWELVHDKI